MIDFKFRRLSAAVFAASASLAVPLAADAQSVQVNKVCACYLTDLSEDGSAATGQMNSNFATFRWTQSGGVQTLGRNMYVGLGGQISGTPRISDDGRTIAATIIDDTHSYGTSGRWTVDGGWEQLGLPADGGILDRNDSSVFGMSGDGRTITGLYWRPNQPGGLAHGSVWTAATGMVGIPTDGGSSRIDGANRDGTVLSGWEEDPVRGYRRATVWVNGARTILDDGGPDGWPSEASAVNADGTIVVGNANNPDTQRVEAVMWKWNGAKWVKKILGVGPHGLASASAYATGVSDDGSIVVGFFRNKFNIFSSGGFVWTQASGLVDAEGWLQSEGVNMKKHLSVIQVSAVSGDGRVLAMYAVQNEPPFGARSLLVTRQEGAQAK